jgi:hypothetical protein
MKAHRQLLIMVAATLAAGFGMACSSSSTGNTGGSDAGPDSSAAADTGPGADSGSPVDAAPESASVSDAGCVIIDNAASVIMGQNVASSEPTAMGGSIPDGTYYVTAVTFYQGPGGTAGPTGQTYQFTSHVSGGTYEAIESISGGKATVFSGTLSISGPNIVVTQTCPPTDAGVSVYDQLSSDGMTTVTFYTSTMPFQSLTFTRQ